MNKIAAALLLSIIAGCTITPAPYTYAQEVCTVNGVVVACYNPDYVVYPAYADAYIWDAEFGAYYFWGGGYRHYMDRDWRYGHGVPRGYWHGNRVYGGHGGFHGGHHR